MALNADIHPTADTPPSFIHGQRTIPSTSRMRWCNLVRSKQPTCPPNTTSMHKGAMVTVFAGPALPVTGWPALVETWLHTINMISTK